MKSAQAASEIKPTLQQVYIKKFNRKLKSMGKDIANSPKNKPSKPWWIYSTGWKKFTQRLKMPQKILQQQEKILNKQIMSPTFSLINDQTKNKDLSSDVEIIKITTVVEAIRQKRQKNAQMLEATKNIQKIIGKKRLKRSLYESGNNSTVNRDLLHARQRKTIVSNKKSRYPKPDYRKQQRTNNKHSLSTRKQLRNKNEADLKTASNVAIPSTVFYKRIWEYINGTRPHSDIINDYNSIENNSEKDNSTCTDKERITASQSQENKSQVTSPNKPERDFYKRIWDIINATQLNENAKIRSKRNANIPKSNAVSSPLCVQEETVNYEEDKQTQATNEELGTTETINSSERSDSGPYISGFWTIANNTQWQPKRIPVVNIAKVNNDPILSSLVNSASEVDDLNKFSDKVENVDHNSSSDNSTGYTNEARNLSQEIITEPGPPYSSEESFATSSFSPVENTADKASQEKDQTKHAENYTTGTTPNYDPLNIPYVEVPDYSDQQEDSLDKSNQSTTAAKYKEYDESDYDYDPKPLYDADDFSSKSPSAEIKVVQPESTDEPDISLNANNSRSSCTESKDSAECVDKYDVEDTKLRNNTENVTDDDVHRSAEDSTKSALSEENENSDSFDINEYKKPINWEEFFKNDPILESIRAGFSKKYNYEENPDHAEESDEAETYATDPKEQSHDYFAKDEDFHNDHTIVSDDKDETNDRKEKTNSYEKKEAKESEKIDKSHYPYDDKDFFKHIFRKDNGKESEHNHEENVDRTEKSEEVETYIADPKEYKENPARTKESEEVETYDYKENPDHAEESEEGETYATDPKEQSEDYFAKNKDYNNHRIISDDRDETDDREKETDSYAKQEAKESEVIDEDSYPYDNRDKANDREEKIDSYAKQEAKENEDSHPFDENFFKHIFEKDNDKEAFDTVNMENEFLSRYFTEDVLRQLRDNSTAEEDKQKEESRNREDIRNTLSRILHKKDHFSRLDENLNKMVEKGEAIPIKYNNSWSLEYESPHKRYEDNEEETEDSKEEA